MLVRATNSAHFNFHQQFIIPQFWFIKKLNAHRFLPCNDRCLDCFYMLSLLSALLLDPIQMIDWIYNSKNLIYLAFGGDFYVLQTTR
jgi:hypothetical protein